ncbi:unnamed protein product [Acanthoscelides obtectus]|uniref:Uncharacterized protein n=1 Tax=Acanthoscelides obtectus TaxID=200917 RepID=A0A9P0K2Z9_ACAOB|nr:unnamed protein product [Acanthoscelides obtectus]CAK1634196.1 hypothetical protein AOBTE_LOCUS8655 [Acanthoscelides obtectus]
MTKRKEQNKLFAINQRMFYNSLLKEGISPTSKDVNRDSFYKYWRSISSTSHKYNEQASWLTTIQGSTKSLTEMPDVYITTDNVKEAVKRLINWKAPGRDKIQNFWIKKLYVLTRALGHMFF